MNCFLETDGINDVIAETSAKIIRSAKPPKQSHYRVRRAPFGQFPAMRSSVWHVGSEAQFHRMNPSDTARAFYRAPAAIWRCNTWGPTGPAKLASRMVWSLLKWPHKCTSRGTGVISNEGKRLIQCSLPRIGFRDPPHNIPGVPKNGPNVFARSEYDLVIFW